MVLKSIISTILMRIFLEPILRNQELLQAQVTDPSWHSPLLDVTFELSGDTLKIYDPDGKPFLTYLEVIEAKKSAEAEAEKQKAAEAERNKKPKQRDKKLKRKNRKLKRKNKKPKQRNKKPRDKKIKQKKLKPMLKKRLR